MPSFKPVRVSRSATLTFDSPIDRVFPLFGPIREKEWAEGWQPEILYSQSPLADEPGAIFVTDHPGEPQTIWIVNRFDVDQRVVEYWRITPGLRLAQVTITCQAGASGVTDATVTYTFTALSEEGSHVVAAFTEDHYQAAIDACLWRAN
jgi:hypothetical protein